MCSRRNQPALVLLSGGLDSAACVLACKQNGLDVSGLFIDYGHRAAAPESAAAHRIAEHYNVPLLIAHFKGLSTSDPGFVQGRNGFLLQAALMLFPHDNGLIAIGIHAGTTYRDCTPGFVDAIQNIFDIYSSGSIRVFAPFLTWHKQDIYNFSAEYSVPVALTYSCESGSTVPCGDCLSCKDMESIRARSKPIS